MEWFRHDIYAHDDIKIKKLLKRYGFTALGAYWFLIELIVCAGGRFDRNEAIEEISLIDGLSDSEAEELVNNLEAVGLIFFDGSCVGSHRSDEEIAFDAESRQKKAEAGRKGGMAKASNAISKSSSATGKPSIATSTSSNAISKASTLPNHTLPIKKEEFVSKDTHSWKESAHLNEGKSVHDALFPHDTALEWQRRFNEISGVVKCRKLTVQKEMLISALVSFFTEEEIDKAFDNLARSSYLHGQNERGWKATFDWFIDINNFAKVFDGNYDDHEGTKKKVATDVNGQYAGFKETIITDF